MLIFTYFPFYFLFFTFLLGDVVSVFVVVVLVGVGVALVLLHVLHRSKGLDEGYDKTRHIIEVS